MPSIGDLIVNVGANIAGFKTAMGDVSSTSASTANAASAAASRINQVFSAAFGAGITTLAFAAANKFDSAFVQIQRSTGATEEKLKSLEDSFTSVYKQTAASSQDVAAALSILSTRTGATGKDLEDLTLKTIKLAKTQREDLNIIVPLVTRAFGDWSIASNVQGKAMDYMRTVSQATGTSVARLAEQVVYAGAPLRQLGYNFEQSAALIGKFEKEGVNTELVLGGMKAALQKFAKEGVTDTAAAWRDFVEGVRSGSVTMQEVMTQVGAKRGVDLYRAITEGRFEIDEMVKSSKRLAEEGGADMETFREKITKITHEIESVIAGHSQLIMAVGLGMPIVTSMWGAFSGGSVAAIAAIKNVSTAISMDMVGALTLGEKVLMGGGVFGLIVTLAGAATLAIREIKTAIDELPDDTSGKAGAKMGFWSGFLGALANNPLTSGLGTGAQLAVNRQPDASDYVKTLPAPPASVLAAGQPQPARGVAGTVEAFHSFTLEESLRADQIKTIWDNIKKTIGEIVNGTYNAPTLLASDITKTPIGYIDQILRPTLDQLREMPVETNAAAAALNGQFSPAVLDSANELMRLQRNAEITTQAYHDMGLKTPAEFKAIADSARQNYEIIKDKAGESAIATQIAWTKAALAQIELDYQVGDVDEELYRQRKKMAEDALATLEGKTKDTTKRIRQYTYSMADEMNRAFSGALDSLARGLASNLVHWQGWKDTLKSAVTNLAEDMTAAFVKGFFQPLEKKLGELAGSIANHLPGWMGGGSGAVQQGTNAASTAGQAGNLGSGMASAASSSIAGWVNAGISAVGTVFSIFQNMHQETSLNAIEHNTRYLQIEAEKFFQQDEWQRHEGLLLKLDDIWNEIRNVVAHVGGGGSGALDTIRDYAVLQVKKFDEFIIPKMDTMIDLMRGGSSGAAPITIHVHGTDVNEMVNRITRHLRMRGVYV